MPELSDVASRIQTFVPRLVLAYKYTRRIEGGSISFNPSSIPKLWILSLSSLILLLLSLIAIFKAGRHDFLNPSEYIDEQIGISLLRGTVEQIALGVSQIASYSLGGASFVILASLFLTAIFYVVVIGWMSIEHPSIGPSTWRYRFRVFGYRMFCLSCRYAACSIIYVTLNIGLQSVYGRWPRSSNEVIVGGSLLMSLTATLAWTILPNFFSLSKQERIQRGRVAMFFVLLS